MIGNWLFICHCRAMPFAVAQSKSEELHLEGTDLEKEMQRKLRGHPLFFGITMGLLAEVINSR